MPQVILSLAYRGFQCSTIRFDFLRNYIQVLSRTWKKLGKDSKCIPFPKGEKKSKGKMLAKTQFFFFSLLEEKPHTYKWLSIKSSTSQVRMGLNRKKEVSPAVMPMQYAFPRNPC